MKEDPGRLAADAVDRLATVVDLTIDPAHRPGVVEAFAGLIRAAGMVMEFPLPDTVEPPSVFRP